jgi:hypothetical protein
MDGWMNGWMDGWMDRWIGGKTDEIDGSMDGWIDGWMNGSKDRWIHRKLRNVDLEPQLTFLGKFEILHKIGFSFISGVDPLLHYVDQNPLCG